MAKGQEGSCGADQGLSGQAESTVPGVWSSGEGSRWSVYSCSSKPPSKRVGLGGKVSWFEVPRTETMTAGITLCPCPQPSLLHACPGEAGNILPEGCAQPTGCQAGCPATLRQLHAAAAATGEGQWGQQGRWGSQVGMPRPRGPHGWVCPQEGGLPVPTPPASPSLCLLRFLASQRALLLLFSDGTVQVSAGFCPQGPQDSAGGDHTGCFSAHCCRTQETISSQGQVLTPKDKTLQN